jgi:hypothetical protein
MARVRSVGLLTSLSSLSSLLNPGVADNLQVQWGSQDHYEIVRKVGRGKYSEVNNWLLYVCRRINRATGFRGRQHCH